MRKISWIYLASYLSIGGIGFAFIPEPTLRLFLSNGDYGDIMPRVVGMFMLALGGLIATMTINNDLRYYPYAVFIRTGMIVFLSWLYMMSKDPLFIVILSIILIGLLPSWYFYLEKSN
jgi:uncharacterized protein YjeT (DUF2065 family)